MPTQSYGTTTIVVTLDKQDIPLVIRLESDSVRGPERRADALVLFQIAQHGPRAKPPVIQDIKETVNSAMATVLVARASTVLTPRGVVIQQVVLKRGDG